MFAFLSFFWGNPAPMPPEAVPVLWQSAKLFDLPTHSDPVVTEIIDDYLKDLEAKGYDPQSQGIWLRTEWAYLAQNQASVPMSVASLTKIATSLAAIAHWGLDHRFETRFYGTGPVENGVLKGDLIVEGGHDPLFVWEEAIAVGNALNQKGIREVSGNLIIVGNFSMNFEADAAIAGRLLQQGLNAKQWSGLIQKQYKNLPPGTPKPEVVIAGIVKEETLVPPQAQPLLRRQSLSLAQLVKQMNIYSNNEIAETLAQSMGGAAVVAQNASRLAAIPAAEIQLKNGSGLAIENRLSPQAVTQLLMALDQQIKPQNLTLFDLFPVMGRDRKGTIEWRSLPPGVAVKTGTLNQVSALAGMIPTQERGPVWFTIINGGTNFDRLRVEQDKVLQRLAQHWQVSSTHLAPGPTDTVILGETSRTQFR